MNDRELLELAAKAAGVQYEFCRPEMGGALVRNSRSTTWWNPLTDDGDALRLAVKLEMQLRILHKENQVSAYGSPDGRVDESVHGDPFAATRRAIVRTAAEIGRNME